MAVKIYHGDILFTPAADQLSVYENSYIIVRGRSGITNL